MFKTWSTLTFGSQAANEAAKETTKCWPKAYDIPEAKRRK